LERKRPLAALLVAGAAVTACSHPVTVSTEQETRVRVDAGTALNSKTGHYTVGPIDVELVKVVQRPEEEIGMAFVMRSSPRSLGGCCTIFPRVALARAAGDPAAGLSVHVYVVEPSSSVTSGATIDMRLVAHDPGPKLLGSFTVELSALGVRGLTSN
jgi:hypothetical protein